MKKSLWSQAPGGVLTAKSVDLDVASSSGDELDSLSTEILSRESPQEPFFFFLLGSLCGQPFPSRNGPGLITSTAFMPFHPFTVG